MVEAQQISVPSQPEVVSQAFRLRWGIPLIKQLGGTTGGDSWIGGAIYLDNLVGALQYLPQEIKPNIILLVEQSLSCNQTKSPHAHTTLQLHPSPLTRLVRCLPRIRQFGGYLYAKDIHPQLRGAIDIVFPCQSPLHFEYFCNAIGWIPDFQHVHLPQFFSARELRRRDRLHRRIAERSYLVVLSSQDAARDFKRLHPAHAHKARVLNFATVPQESWFDEEPQDVGQKYGLPEVFVLVSNQFWMHKNHLCVFEAVRFLRQEGKVVNVVCTGFTGDYRNQHYFDEVKAFIEDNNLQSCIHILGLIPRGDQIQIMRRAAIVVQPSLFEGWSTVVEDVRALGKRVIVSDLAVHREQNVASAIYFDPQSPRALADTLIDQMSTFVPGPDVEMESACRVKHEQRVLSFAQRFLQIASEAASR